MHTHSCIKCKAQYQDKDPDPYYCPKCNEKRIEIAKKIDAKPPKPKKDRTNLLAAYEAAPKVRGFMHVTLDQL